ncbi:hypothetical protein FPV67DRAFT_1510279 [Lyophyllum atratum]|nr:hypothetical protein FPV67DRAFT_1510279 [Lyophyllum atratum]
MMTTSTPTLFTLLALFLSLFTLASAFPTSIESASARVVVAKPVPAVGPRSLLGRFYLRHNLGLAPTHSSRSVILPAESDEFVGRADRFQALQRRRAARSVQVQVRALARRDATENAFLQNHTIPIAAPAAKSPVVSTQVQAPLAVATPRVPAPRPAPVRAGSLKHHGLKKSAASKHAGSL